VKFIDGWGEKGNPPCVPLCFIPNPDLSPKLIPDPPFTAVRLKFKFWLELLGCANSADEDILTSFPKMELLELGAAGVPKNEEVLETVLFPMLF
jgi:hypothetical protein